MKKSSAINKMKKSSATVLVVAGALCAVFGTHPCVLPDVYALRLRVQLRTDAHGTSPTSAAEGPAKFEAAAADKSAEAAHSAELAEVEEKAELASLIADAIKESKKQEKRPKSWVWKWAKRAGAALLGAGAVAGTVVGLVPFIGDQINAQIDGIADNIRTEISGTATHFETEITASQEHTSAEIEKLANKADNKINAVGGQATTELNKINDIPVVKFFVEP